MSAHRRDRVTVGGVTFLAMAAGAFPVYAVGAMGPVLVERLGTDRAGLGTLTALVFGSAAVTSSLLGRLADRWGARRSLGVAMGLALALAATATALTGYAMVAVWAVAAGPLLATGNPVCNRLIAGLPDGERGVVMGVKQAGVQASTVLAGLVAPPLALAYGWRAALAAGAVPAVAVIAAMPLLPRQGSRDAVASEVSRGGAPGGSASPVARLRLYAFLMGSGVACVLVFLPVYATDTGVMGPVGAGALLSVLGMNAVVARIVLGREVERSGAFTARLAAFGLLGVVGVATLLGVVAVPQAAAAPLWLAAVLLGWSAMSWNVVAMLYVVVHAGRRDAGAVSGTVLVGFYAGIAATPTVFGWLVERGLPYAATWGAVAACFLAAAAVGRGLPAPREPAPALTTDIL